MLLNDAFKCKHKEMKHFPFLALPLALALWYFTRVFACACICVCVSRVNQPFSLDIFVMDEVR